VPTSLLPPLTGAITVLLDAAAASKVSDARRPVEESSGGAARGT
jgi:hypothetical protein